jgi:membrane dipeptidase
MKPFNRRVLLKTFVVGLGLAGCQSTGLFTHIPAPSLEIPAPEKPMQPTTQPSSAEPQPSYPTISPIQSDSPSERVTLSPVALTASLLDFTIDGHEDIAWNALEYERNPHQSALSSRPSEAASGLADVIGERTAGLPEWLSGRIGIIFATLFVMPARRETQPRHTMIYNTPREAELHARRQLAYYHVLAEDGASPFRLLTSLSRLDEVLSTWHSDRDPSSRLIGLAPLMEGADSIVSPADLPGWHQAGLHMVGLSWAATQYAGGTGEPGPLTDLGRELLKVMADLNMALDLSHASEEAFMEAVDLYPGTVIASHSNPLTFLPSDRGLSDAMLKKLAARDGVVGIVPYNRFLLPGWQPGSQRAGIARVVEAIDYVVQLTGSSRHVALGTDFDGGLGPEALPEGMDTIADLQKIVSALQSTGYSNIDIQAISHNNWLRTLREILSQE